MLNHASRKQNERLFSNEFTSDFLNKDGPGPSYYTFEKANTSLSGEKFRYSIPKVTFFTFDYLFYVD